MFRSLAERKESFFFFFEYEYQVKLQKKQWRDDLKRLKETKKRGKDSINDYHDTREDVDREEDDSFARFCSPGRRMCKLDCMYDSICKARLTGLCFLFVEG